VHQEINVIGQHAEEARDAVDEFLDRAVMATASRVRIVHGHGMGVLRKTMIAEMLAHHPHVLSSTRRRSRKAAPGRPSWNAVSAGETREYLRSKANEGSDLLKEHTSDLKQTAAEWVDKGKDALNRQKGNLADAVEAGKQAYRDARGPQKPAEETV
jgi:hypothetical protein